MQLNEVKEGQSGLIRAVNGSVTFQRRVAAVGITPGCRFTVVQNPKRYPVLLQVRSTMLALDRKDCEEISVEVE